MTLSWPVEVLAESLPYLYIIKYAAGFNACKVSSVHLLLLGSNDGEFLLVCGFGGGLRASADGPRCGGANVPTRLGPIRGCHRRRRAEPHARNGDSQGVRRSARQRNNARPQDGAELVSSLYAYLLSGRNAAQAACRLFVHRNTFDYRIAKIERTIGFELESISDEEAIRLILSCKLLLSEEERA